MEGDFHRNVSLELIIHTSSATAIPKINTSLTKNENKLRGPCTGYNIGQIFEASKDGKPGISGTEVIDFIKCRIKNFLRFNKILVRGVILLHSTKISMLKRSYSMEFESDEFKSSPAQASDSSSVAGTANSKETDENLRHTKKTFNSTNADEGKVSKESDASPEINPSSCRGRAEAYRGLYSQTGDNVHVTQSRSIFSHEDSFVYGNPKEDIKNIEKPCGTEAIGTTSPFENSSSSVLDLSCKGTKADDEKPQPPTDGDTYQNYMRGNFATESSFPRSNSDVKLVNPASKKPSIPEQLQIAKIQQQQRRSMQQQQKFLQQMRRSLDPKSSNRQDSPQTTHKNFKYYGNTTTNHEQNDLDNHARVKDFQPQVSGSHFPQLPYPYFDPNHPKELPDNHPILPLLDPVYFSALYNAHGFLPPSSPSIAAAFIGTLQDALPKLPPAMFPSTSSNTMPLLPQNANENPN